MTEAELVQAANAAQERGAGVQKTLTQNPLTRAFAEPFGQVDYTKFATQGRPFAELTTSEKARAVTVAEIMHMADIGRNVVNELPNWEKTLRAEVEATWQKKLDTEIRPAIEREARAKILGDDVPLDTGSGGAPGNETDDAFLVAYGRGESTDHRRARQLTGIK